MQTEVFVNKTVELFEESIIQRTRDLFRECIETTKTKGVEYQAGSDDKFANFRREAMKIGVPPELIWHVYVAKHMDSIDNFIKRIMAGESVCSIDASLSEPIQGRIKDAIVYLFILNGMVEEEKEIESTSTANRD